MVLSQKDLDESLAKSRDTQTATIKALLAESIAIVREEIISTLSEENKKLRERVTVLEEKVESLESKLEQNLQYQRNSSVIVAGLPHGIEHNKLEGIIINIFNTVCFHNITPRDIVACHRLSAISGSVIVKFVNKKDAVALLQSKMALKELDKTTISPDCKGIYVNEHLTPFVGALAYKCRCLKRNGKIYQTKVEKGVVKILTNKGGSFRWYIINNIYDLNEFDQEVPEHVSNTEGGDS